MRRIRTIAATLPLHIHCPVLVAASRHAISISAVVLRWNQLSTEVYIVYFRTQTPYYIYTLGLAHCRLQSVKGFSAL